MPQNDPFHPPLTIGLVGLGAFGQLIARHLGSHFPIEAHDPAPAAHAAAARLNVTLTTLERVASHPVIVIATPVSRIAGVVEAIAPHIHPGTLVLDVGSVKLAPAGIMRRGLPEHADIVATHPLFGPQSARDGIAGLKIALCPVRGRRHLRLAAFLRRYLRLDVIVTTAERHDREAATVQGLTHLIAKVLTRMEPLPIRMTTRSFDLLLAAVEMVRFDAPEIFEAIEGENPYSADIRRRFFELASELESELAGRRDLSPPIP